MLSTMDTALAIPAFLGALFLTALASLFLALFVLLRTRSVPGAGLLIAFLIGVALWCLAQAAPALLGTAAGPLTTRLIALAPLAAATFVHLVFAYARSGHVRTVALASYALALIATLAGLIFGVGGVVPWRDFPGFFVPSVMGWAVFGVAGGLSVLGHARLYRLWIGQQGGGRDQARTVFAASAIGLIALTGFAFPALGIDLYPWPVLLLPLYAVLLLHSILRHRFMAADLWARRGLVSLLLLGGAGAASALIAALPLALMGRPAGFLATWAALAGTLLLGFALMGPLRRLADRLAFPGGVLSDQDIAAWRDRLADADDTDQLTDLANRLLRQRLKLDEQGTDDNQAPSLQISGDQVILTGWDGAPMPTRQLAERFAQLVAEAARRLAAAHRLVEAERADRLADLGALAASVAHDLRNPLGIVKMAATGAPADVRADIDEQIGRMNHLIGDILDYARAWSVTPQPVTLSSAAAGLAQRHGVELQLPADMRVFADPAALDRVLANLVDNARAPGVRVALIGNPGPPATIDICDDGPGIPPDITASLFRPFVSRRPGGTGLGLAITRRIMEAHGGSVELADVELTDRPGWTTCFRLTFPTPQSGTIDDPAC